MAKHNIGRVKSHPVLLRRTRAGRRIGSRRGSKASGWGAILRAIVTILDALSKG